MQIILDLAAELNDTAFNRIRLKNSSKIINIITWCQILIKELRIIITSINIIPVISSNLDTQFDKHNINIKIRINL